VIFVLGAVPLLAVPYGLPSWLEAIIYTEGITFNFDRGHKILIVVLPSNTNQVTKTTR
jgi:hypothetical protein